MWRDLTSPSIPQHLAMTNRSLLLYHLPHSSVPRQYSMDQIGRGTFTSGTTSLHLDAAAGVCTGTATSMGGPAVMWFVVACATQNFPPCCERWCFGWHCDGTSLPGLPTNAPLRNRLFVSFARWRRMTTAKGRKGPGMEVEWNSKEVAKWALKRGWRAGLASCVATNTAHGATETRDCWWS